MSELESGPFRGLKVSPYPEGAELGAGIAAVGLFFTARADGFLIREPTRSEVLELVVGAVAAALAAGVAVDVSAEVLPDESGRNGWQLAVRVARPPMH